jgi:acyl-CoA synthetase (NDP forming)
MQSIFQVSQYQIQENQSPQPLPEIDLTTYDHIHRALDEHESKQLFKQFGISTVNEVIVRLDELEKSNFSQFGSQVVIKILSKEIIHKTEVGGVALNVPISHIPEAIKKMQEKVLQISGIKIEEFLVQEQASGGLEFIIGMYRDPLGAAILVGMGGITAELFQDTSLRLLTPQTPLTQQEARAMLQELKIWPLLNGYRGRPAYDVNALTKAIVHFSELILMMKDRLLECEINPIFVFEENQGAQAADGIAILA